MNRVNHKKKSRIDDPSLSCDSHDTIDTHHQFMESFSSLYLSPKLSDITLMVDGEAIHAHKCVLQTQSDFFDVMFMTDMIESNQTQIELKETPLTVFKLLLKLVYHGSLSLVEVTPKEMIELFVLSERYQFVKYRDALLLKIRNNMRPQNIWQLFDASVEYRHNDCIEMCFCYLNEIIMEFKLFSCDEFYSFVSHGSLKYLFSRNDLNVTEIDIFKAVCKWIKRNNEVSDDVKREIIKCVRLTHISNDNLIKYVRESGIVSEKVYHEFIITAVCNYGK